VLSGVGPPAAWIAAMSSLKVSVASTTASFTLEHPAAPTGSWIEPPETSRVSE